MTMGDEFRQRVIESVLAETHLKSNERTAVELALDVLASEAWVRDEWHKAISGARFTMNRAEAVQATLKRGDA